MGREHSRRMGNGHSEFRLVDWNWPRRNFDLGNPAAVTTKVANVDQSLCRSHDLVCSRAGRHVSAHAPRTAMAGLLAVSLSEHDGHLASISQSFDVGRLS